MGALALPTPWIPEDDLLLKNAIEAGASLESLAKGAVQFSRRFTIKELQDRWLALLYDPIISTKAAEQMLELERSTSNVQSKSNRGDNSKVTKNAHEKRKAESVRRCYYAMRKRVCDEPLNHGDLNFLVAPGDNCFISGAEAPVPDNMLADPMGSHFGLENAGFDDFQAQWNFDATMRDGAPPCGVSEYSMEQHNTHEDHMDQSAMLGHSMGIKELPGHNMFEGSGIQANLGCNSKDIMCSGFEGNAIFGSSMSLGTSIPHLQYTSPPPAMPDWKTIEGISVPEMPDDVRIRGKTLQIVDSFVISGDGDGDARRTSEYDVIHTESELNNQIPCDALKPSSGCPNGLEDLPDSVMKTTRFLAGFLEGFFEDDEMPTSPSGKDVDKTYLGLHSLLLNSPNEAHEDKLPNVPEAKEAAAADVYIDIPSNTGLEEKNDAGDTQSGDANLQNNSDTCIPSSASCVNSEFPEYRDGVICCTLNTEDPEIPCNDDIIFPIKQRSASVNRRSQSEAYNPSLRGKVNTGTQLSGKGVSTMKRDQKRFGESLPASQTRGSDVGLNCVVDDSGVKFETCRTDMFNGPRSSNNIYGGSCQSSQAVKKEPLELPLARQSGGTLAEQPGQIAVGGSDQEAKASLALRNQELNALGSVDCMGSEFGGEPLLSDPEEQCSESDMDIPYFSDVESMILDMDLGPEDQDNFCSREVAKYQHEDVKRAIIRLEQNAHSYMQRAIASHGALAILYGRHSKHYIKKSEVLLGRATDDVVVDIDLGREGRANKISRRQAIIKMDKDGAFSLKNTGKCSIYTNNKEIFPGQSLGLHSNCLIEIRGMPFIFETNQARVKQYLDNDARKLKDKRVNI